MIVRSGFPILSTGDLERLVSFYRDAFGAEQTYAFADGGRDVYVSLDVGGASLGVGLTQDVLPEPGRVALWFYVDDVDEAYRRALDAGAASVAEPADMPWGERVAQVRDPDGLVVNLGADAT